MRKIRSLGTFWVAEQTMVHLEAIRTRELETALNFLPPKGRVLEIGAGSGWQARLLSGRGYEVSAIDVPTSGYRENRVWEVVEYDGRIIPFADKTFDILFSSNVLEHIPHIDEFQQELRRVLKAEGVMVHVLPSTSWRFWTNLTHVLKSWNPPKAHGEQASNALMELYYFRRAWWVESFRKAGWNVVSEASSGLFYTGSSIMDSRLSVKTRSKLSHLLGSACNIFVVRNV
jgi:ubiquinone/menaquinone biosynthesis C-methylase UbiE